MCPEYVDAGEPLVEQGTTGDKFYVLEYGVLNVVINGDTVNQIAPGTATGELALIHNCPRTASLVAASACTAWSLERKLFRRLLAAKASSQIAELTKFLSGTPNAFSTSKKLILLCNYTSC